MTTKELLTKCRSQLTFLNAQYGEKQSTTSIISEIDRRLSDWIEGDKIRITQRLYGHGFNIGDEVVIIYVREENNDYKCELDGEEFWIRKDEGEKIQPIV